MPQTSRTLSPHLQKMKLEMELRGLSPQTLRHYLSRLRLLEKYFNKPAFNVSPDELKQYLYYRIKSGISYSSRVAISNSRIKSFDGKSVSFSWKDYKDGNKSKVMTLGAEESSRRFLLHVLPTRFTKIRHYGILCSRNISSKLSKCMTLAGKSPFRLTAKKYTKTGRSCGSQNIIMFFPKHSCSDP
jgi:Putative transposase./Phage integrase, N-terminal SAM-like domain.